MFHCGCEASHGRRRIVLTGGPGAGKTASLELARQVFCPHVLVLKESAGMLFGGGFPRNGSLAARQAAQRAIYHVQRELEEAAAVLDSALVVCDRGTLDGSAYWPGPGTLFDAVGTTTEAELARYDAVIHLRTPRLELGYDHMNPLRVESADEAVALDQRLLEAWEGHPRRIVIEANSDFIAKILQVVDALRAEVPTCCGGRFR